jgi:hypothetical protein
MGVHSTRECLSLYVALSGFDHPLSGLLLPDPLSHIPDSSVHGIYPFRVLLTLKSCAPYEVGCSPDLWCSAPGRRQQRNLAFRALVPSKSRVLQTAIKQKTEPLLSWGYTSLRHYPLQPFQPLRAFYSSALSVHYPEDDDNEPGALEVFC